MEDSNKNPNWRVGWLRASLALLALAGTGVLPARADLVTDWAATAAQTIAPMGGATGTPEERYPVYPADLATVHVAIYDTANAFAARYEPFAAVPNVPLKGASVDAAIDEAAYTVLSTLFPSRSALYLTAYQSRLAALAAAGVTADAIDRGRAVGRDVAVQVIGWRANDGRLTPAPWSQGTQPGQFVSPNPAALVNLNVPSMRPFTMASASQFRPDGPPALASAEYAETYEEVRATGIDDARSSRTTDEDDLAKMHTEAPPVFWPRNMTRFARDPDLVDNARLLAAIWVAQADATIACFDAKYHYNFWRPRTAIPNGGADGNPETNGDATWLPNEPTPNHPEYPAAHGCAAGSVMEVIRQIHGTKKVSFTIDSLVPGVIQVAREYRSTDDFLRDVKDARVLGGMHFRFSVDDGTSVGRQVAKRVMKHYFRPADCHD